VSSSPPFAVLSFASISPHPYSTMAGLDPATQQASVGEP
jgi:hypothetical protein